MTLFWGTAMVSYPPEAAVGNGRVPHPGLTAVVFGLQTLTVPLETNSRRVGPVNMQPGAPTDVAAIA
ncbi:MAG: hypothetical protein QOG52_1194 [Frankiaceae bacterium]|nr:hypothetical protein [Frankiaceae bacterium]